MRRKKKYRANFSFFFASWKLMDVIDGGKVPLGGVDVCFFLIGAATNRPGCLIFTRWSFSLLQTTSFYSFVPSENAALFSACRPPQSMQRKS
jgi:hypothetical protein